MYIENGSYWNYPSMIILNYPLTRIARLAAVAKVVVIPCQRSDQNLSHPKPLRFPLTTSGMLLHDVLRVFSPTSIPTMNKSTLMNSMSTGNFQTSPPLSVFASHFGLDPSTNRFHAPMVYHERYSFPEWPDHFTFPMDKFERLCHAVTTTCKATHPQSSSLSRPLVRSIKDMFRPLDYDNVPRDWLSGPIDATFLDRFCRGALTEEECRRIGFREQTSRPELIRRTVLEVAGTVLTTQLALRYRVAANLAGGTHHARPSEGAGYTILNDLAVAAFVALELNAEVERVLVIDCDVHQGDGTAIFGSTDVLKGRMFTLSLHCGSNYPHPKATSTFDVALPDKMEDEEYLKVLQESVDLAMRQVKPDLVIYDAGVDVYRGDRLGRLLLTEQGIRQRDRFVIDRCVETYKVPIAAVIGGGYDKDVDALARRHAIVHEECSYVWRKHQLWKRVASE